jgi:peptidyl-prolyl cis-trans isomerase C
MKLAIASYLCAGLFFGAHTALATETVGVVAAYGDTVLLADELAAETEALPAAARAGFAGSADSRRKLATELLVRRQIAERARREGLADDPAVRHRLRLLEERLLYLEYMQRAEAAALSEAAIEQMAFDEYRVHRDKFTTAEAVRASHVLLRFGGKGRDRAQTEALMRELRGRLQAGEDFAELARELSEDPGSARKGGDLGFFERGRMAKPFEEAAFALQQPGDLSDIVETKFGLHIIRLTERRAAGQRSFEEVREELIKKNRNRARKSVRLDLIEPLRDPARLTIDDAALEAVFAAE